MPCETKVRFMTRVVADRHLERMLADPTVKKADKRRLNSYRCRRCGFFHLGRSPEWRLLQKKGVGPR